MGGQNGRKIEIFGVFLDMLFETLILVENCSIFDNFDVGMVKTPFFPWGVVGAFGGVWVESKMP